MADDSHPLVVPSPHGLYCEAGDFFIDPWKPVDRAIVTHAHSDHARSGCKGYLCSASGKGILHERVGAHATIEGISFGERLNINGVSVTLYPAGHILGSAQVRVEYKGRILVVSGDYKTDQDKSCEAFEPVPCHTFITESTFGLPLYRWPKPEEVFAEINDWWRENQAEGRVSVIFAYALGKAQRVLAGIDRSIGPVHVHGTVNRFLPHYRHAGVDLSAVVHGTSENIADAKGKGLVIAPASVQGTPWLRKYGKASLAFASGWMLVRGARRRRALDRGFVMSDHCDWSGLLGAIKATGCESVGVTHGYTRPLIRWLTEQGVHTYDVPTRFSEEPPDDEENTEEKGEAI